MIIGILIFIVSLAILTSFIFVYERPTKKRRKISGRGGDFSE